MSQARAECAHLDDRVASAVRGFYKKHWNQRVAVLGIELCNLREYASKLTRDKERMSESIGVFAEEVCKLGRSYASARPEEFPPELHDIQADAMLMRDCLLPELVERGEAVVESARKYRDSSLLSRRKHRATLLSAADDFLETLYEKITPKSREIYWKNAYFREFHRRREELGAMEI